MIAFLLWVIVLIIAWPIALALAVGALAYGLIIAGFWLIVFSIKVMTALVIRTASACKSLARWNDHRKQSAMPSIRSDLGGY